MEELKQEKDFVVYVTIKMVNFLSATSKEDAVFIIKEQYKQDYNIELADEEIEVAVEV